MSTMDRPALTFDEMLEQGQPATEYVPLCLNGELVKKYEEITARIEHRAALAQMGAQVDENDPDIRLGGGAPAPAGALKPGEPDPEQEEADRLKAEMRRFTQVFVLNAVGEKYQELLEQHPPRPDPLDAKKYHPEDRQGFNSMTFYPALVRASIVKPEMTDPRWEKLMRGKSRISDGQFDRLAAAAIKANKKDDDLPFLLDASGRLLP